MKFTVINDHTSPGEGHIVMILYCMADNEDAARRRFGEHFDSYFMAGTEIMGGFVFDTPLTDFLVAPAVRTALQMGAATEYHTALHYTPN